MVSTLPPPEVIRLFFERRTTRPSIRKTKVVYWQRTANSLPSIALAYHVCVPYSDWVTVVAGLIKAIPSATIQVHSQPVLSATTAGAKAAILAYHKELGHVVSTMHADTRFVHERLS